MTTITVRTDNFQRLSPVTGKVAAYRYQKAAQASQPLLSALGITALDVDRLRPHVTDNSVVDGIAFTVVRPDKSPGTLGIHYPIGVFSRFWRSPQHKLLLALQKLAPELNKIRAGEA